MKKPDKIKQRAGSLGGKKLLEMKGKEYFSKLIRKRWKKEKALSAKK